MQFLSDNCVLSLTHTAEKLTFQQILKQENAPTRAVCSAKQKGLGEAQLRNKGPLAGLCSLLATKNERRIVGVTLGKLHRPGSREKKMQELL